MKDCGAAWEWVRTRPSRRMGNLTSQDPTWKNQQLAAPNSMSSKATTTCCICNTGNCLVIWKSQSTHTKNMGYKTRQTEQGFVKYLLHVRNSRPKECNWKWYGNGTGRGVPRILPGGMHIFVWPTPSPRIRIRIKILSWIRIRICIKTIFFKYI